MTVQGSIGSDQVYLENAATESTLREILKAMISQQKGNGNVDVATLNKVLSGSSLSPETIQRANNSLSGLNKVAFGVGYSFGQLHKYSTQLTAVFDNASKIFTTFTNSAGRSSDVFSLLSQQGGAVGLLGRVFEATAKYGEESLEAYRQLTRSGINFAGDFREIQMAAANANVSLDTFTTILKNNSEAFVKMGMGANQGAVEFSLLSSNFQKQFGTKLRSLGLTAEDLNNGLANYINMIGGVSKTELQSSDKLFKSTQNYLLELDALSDLTGKSKEKLEEETKAAMTQSAVQRKLLTMDPTSAGQVNAAIRAATATGIPGLVEAMQARILGLPETTEQAQMLAGLAPEIVAEGYAMVDQALSGTLTSVKTGFSRIVDASKTVTNRLGTTGDYLSIQQGALNNTTIGIQTFSNQMNRVTDVEALFEESVRDRTAREVSDAEKAAEVEQQMLEIRKQIMDELTELAKIGLPLLLDIVKLTKDAVGVFKGIVDNLPGGLVTAIGVVIGAFVGLKIALGTLQAYINKMVLGGGAGGGGVGGGGDDGEKGGKGKGRRGKFIRGLKVGGALGAAGAVLTALDTFGTMTEIDQEIASGAITKQAGEQEKQKAVYGGVGGAAGGALGGALGGAAIGAFAGPVGAAIGGIIGGTLGAFGGTTAGEAIANLDDKKIAELSTTNIQATASLPTEVERSLLDLPSVTEQTKMMLASGTIDNNAVSELLRINNESLRILKNINDSVGRATTAFGRMNPNLFGR